MTRARKSRKTRGDYEVGYGRPPAQHRFAKGTSGNPRGRPRSKRAAVGSSTLLESLERLARREIAIVLNGKETSLTVMEAILVKTQQQALEGKQDAVRTLVSLQAKVDKWRMEKPVSSEGISLRQMDPNEAVKAYLDFIGQRS